MMMPPTTNAVATVIGLNRYSWIRSAKITPNTTAGRNAISRLAVKRRALGCVGKPMTTSKILRRNSQTTARIAPSWMMMLNAMARSPPKFEQVGDDDLVSGTGNGQKLRQPFYNS